MQFKSILVSLVASAALAQAVEYATVSSISSVLAS